MLEFLMVIPLLALVIAAVYFFAWGLRNAMGLRMSDRYLTWAIIHEVPLFDHRYGITPHDVIMDHLLVRRTVGHIYHHKLYDVKDSAQTTRDLADYVADYSMEAYPVADELLTREWSRGFGIRLFATFPTPVGPWGDISNQYTDQYIRASVEWRAGQAEHEEELTDEFQRELDRALRRVPRESKAAAEVFRTLYLETWQRQVPR